jgi:hypothetical protein
MQPLTQKRTLPDGCENHVNTKRQKRTVKQKYQQRKQLSLWLQEFLLVDIIDTYVLPFVGLLYDMAFEYRNTYLQDPLEICRGSELDSDKYEDVSLLVDPLFRMVEKRKLIGQKALTLVQEGKGVTRDWTFLYIDFTSKTSKGKFTPVNSEALRLNPLDFPNLVWLSIDLNDREKPDSRVLNLISEFLFTCPNLEGIEIYGYNDQYHDSLWPVIKSTIQSFLIHDESLICKLWDESLFEKDSKCIIDEIQVLRCGLDIVTFYPDQGEFLDFCGTDIATLYPYQFEFEYLAKSDPGFFVFQYKTWCELLKRISNFPRVTCIQVTDCYVTDCYDFDHTNGFVHWKKLTRVIPSWIFSGSITGTFLQMMKKECPGFHDCKNLTLDSCFFTEPQKLASVLKEIPTSIRCFTSEHLVDVDSNETFLLLESFLTERKHLEYCLLHGHDMRNVNVSTLELFFQKILNFPFRLVLSWILPNNLNIKLKTCDPSSIQPLVWSHYNQDHGRFFTNRSVLSDQVLVKHD